MKAGRPRTSTKSATAVSRPEGASSGARLRKSNVTQIPARSARIAARTAAASGLVNVKSILHNTPMSAATCGTMAQRLSKKFAICVDDDDRADDHVARYRLAHGGLPF